MGLFMGLVARMCRHEHVEVVSKLVLPNNEKTSVTTPAIFVTPTVTKGNRRVNCYYEELHSISIISQNADGHSDTDVPATAHSCTNDVLYICAYVVSHLGLQKAAILLSCSAPETRCNMTWAQRYRAPLFSKMQVAALIDSRSRLHFGKMQHPAIFEPTSCCTYFCKASQYGNKVQRGAI